MQDWEPRLLDLEPRLAAWNRAVDAEFARLCKERKLVGFLRKSRPTELDLALFEARRRTGDAILVEAVSLFDALCERYPAALPQERAKIRARVGDREAVWDLFWTYVESGPERIRGAGAALELERALIALSIEDLRHDIELIDAIAGQLAVAAASLGLDWRAAFAKTALVSNRSTGGGAGQMREYLEGFERSKHYQREVASEIKAAQKRAFEPTDLMHGRGRGGAVA